MHGLAADKHFAIRSTQFPFIGIRKLELTFDRRDPRQFKNKPKAYLVRIAYFQTV
jgi:hypothetical protein